LRFSSIFTIVLSTALSKWSCGDVQPPTNGKLTVVSYRLLAKNTAIFAFSCKPGYTLKGPMCALCVDGVIRRMPKCVGKFKLFATDVAVNRRKGGQSYFTCERYSRNLAKKYCFSL